MKQTRSQTQRFYLLVGIIVCVGFTDPARAFWQETEVGGCSGKKTHVTWIHTSQVDSLVSGTNWARFRVQEDSPMEGQRKGARSLLPREDPRRRVRVFLRPQEAMLPPNFPADAAERNSREFLALSVESGGICGSSAGLGTDRTKPDPSFEGSLRRIHGNKIPGSASGDTYDVIWSGLRPGQRYGIAVCSYDDRSGSSLSKLYLFSTAEAPTGVSAGTPPQPSGLVTLTQGELGSRVIRWKAAADQETPHAGLKYRVVRQRGRNSLLRSVLPVVSAVPGLANAVPKVIADWTADLTETIDAEPALLNVTDYYAVVVKDPEGNVALYNFGQFPENAAERGAIYSISGRLVAKNTDDFRFQNFRSDETEANSGDRKAMYQKEVFRPSCHACPLAPASDNIMVDVIGFGFKFPTKVAAGEPYSVTVSAKPGNTNCSVSAGVGFVEDSDIDDVVVTCDPGLESVNVLSATVTGLNRGQSLKVRVSSQGASAPFDSLLFDNGRTRLVDAGVNVPLAISVLSQPDGQYCTLQTESVTLSAGNPADVAIDCKTLARRFSGSVIGLESGKTITLRKDGREDLVVNNNGTYTFSEAVNVGDSYQCEIASGPAQQTCTIANASGIAGVDRIPGFRVACTSSPVTTPTEPDANTETPTYTLSGDFGGLYSGTNVVLRLNSEATTDLTLPGTANGFGSWSFTTKLAATNPYNVTIVSQPSGGTCSVSDGSGTVSANVNNIFVYCSPPPVYSIGGTVSGLSAGTLVLRNNGGNNKTITANGSFYFSSGLLAGAAYAVTVGTQPATLTCTIANGSGNVGFSAVTNVSVTCGPPVTYSLSGSFSGLYSPNSAVLRLNADAGNDVTLTGTANGTGSFNFPSPLNPGSAYATTIVSQPSGGTCNLSNGSGTANSNVSNISLYCSPPTFQIGGTVSGLTAGTLVLRNLGFNPTFLTANGNFAFSVGLRQGENYAVTVDTQPSGRTCTIANGSGTVGTSAITSVAVTCIP